MTFWEQHRKTILITLGVVLAIAGAFVGGKYSTPASVKEVIKTVEVEKVVEVEKEVIKVVDRIVYVQKQNNDVRTETTTKVAPDGSSTTTTVVVDKTKTDTASSRETDTVAVKEKIVYVDREKVVESTKIVTNSKPQWKLSLRAEGGALLAQPIVPIVSLGVQAERRIVGPFFMGLSVSVDMGVNATGITGPYGVKGGLVLGVEF